MTTPRYPNFGTTNVVPSVGFPATIAGSGSWTSGVIVNYGFAALQASVESTQAGQLTIQRYADLAGLIPIGTVATQAISASTQAWTAINDGTPFLSYSVTITNTSESTATITKTSITSGPR